MIEKKVNGKSSVNQNLYHLLSFLPFAFILFNCSISYKQGASSLLFHMLNILVVKLMVPMVSLDEIGSS